MRNVVHKLISTINPGEDCIKTLMEMKLLRTRLHLRMLATERDNHEAAD